MKHSLKFSYGILVLLLLFTLLLTGSVSAQDATPEADHDYKIVYMAFMGWGFVDVADVKGYWEDEGLNIELAPYVSVQDEMLAIENERTDFYVINLPALMQSASHNSNMVYLGTFGFGGGGGVQVMVREELVGESLAGKTVGTYSMEDMALMPLAAYLESVGNTLDDVRLVTMTPDESVDNFIAERLDVAVVITRQAEILESGGVMVEASPMVPLGMGSYRDVVENIPPEDLVKIQRGLYRAIQWHTDPANLQEYVDITNTTTLAGLSPITTELWGAVLRDMLIYPTPAELLVYNQNDAETDFNSFREGLLRIGYDEDILAEVTYENTVRSAALMQVFEELAGGE